MPRKPDDPKKALLYDPKSHLPSLYHRLPQPGPLAATHQADALGTLLDKGTVASILTTLLVEDAKRSSKHEYSLAAKRKRDSEARKRTKSDHDPTSDDDDDESAAEVAQRARKRPGTRRVKNAAAPPREVAEIAIPEHQLPPDLPSGDLLASIHSYTSHLLSSSPHQFILPPLSSKHHTSLPAAFQSKVDQLQTDILEIEQVLANDTTRGSESKWKKWKQGRLLKKFAGARDDRVWTNVDRAWEASSLVALGTLMQLLAENMVSGSEPTNEDYQQLQGQDSDFEDEQARERRRIAKGKGRATSPFPSPVVEDSEPEISDLEAVLCRRMEMDGVDSEEEDFQAEEQQVWQGVGTQSRVT